MVETLEKEFSIRTNYCSEDTISSELPAYLGRLAAAVDQAKPPGKNVNSTAYEETGP
jgi:hypothetical protein